MSSETEQPSSAPAHGVHHGEKDTYAGPRSTTEYNRLRVQHDFIKYVMNGELVVAPIDRASPDLQVLDSATGDGYWLVDLAPELEPTATLVGADIAPQHFIAPADLPKNVELVRHNIFETWPEQYQARFDLVHQRFVLMVANDENSEKAVRNLWATVKPGGWIQLHDGDMDTIEEGYPTMEKFRDVVRKGWQALGFNLSPGPKLAGWLKDAGANDVKERVLTVKCGKSAGNREQGERVVFMFLSSLDNMKALTEKIPGFPYTASDIETLKGDLEKELWETGNSYHTHVVWAQKPL